MKVTMLTSIAGPDISLAPGDVHDFPEHEAINFIQAGFAAPFVEEVIERAVKKPSFEKRAK